MPVLIELHEAYAERGLAVVGVHVDNDGDVSTAERLDTLTANFRKTLWKEKDLPFPSALVAGHKVGDGETAARSRAAWQYGVFSYPTTILIDREGKVVERFHARDMKSAREQVEKLLAGAK
jgi:glutathione peroxidase-family protein